MPIFIIGSLRGPQSLNFDQILTKFWQNKIFCPKILKSLILVDKNTLILEKIMKKFHHHYFGPWARGKWYLNHVFAQSHWLTGRKNNDGIFSLFFPHLAYFNDLWIFFSWKLKIISFLSPLNHVLAQTYRATGQDNGDEFFALFFPYFAYLNNPRKKISRNLKNI